MKYDITSPCAGCPFKPDAPPGYLGGVYTAKGIIADICNEIPFICHVHVENTSGYHGSDWKERLGDNAQHCAGALIMARKMCKMPRDAEHAAAVANIDRDQEILFPPQAFIDYHTSPEKFDEFVKQAVPAHGKKRLARNKRRKGRRRQ